jgi:ABC transport system ATP-binding/permease protein
MLGPRMTSPRRWIVGRAPNCDLVVDVAEVSSRHCCLYSTERGFVLEDLGSANGTFVNGERLTKKAFVKPGDSITLGQRTPFPWPNSQPSSQPPPIPPPIPGKSSGNSSHRGSPRARAVGASSSDGLTRPMAAAGGAAAKVTIGRAPDNDLVLDHPGVSNHHAVLTPEPGGHRLHDIGSSNGTAIGHPANRVQEAVLRPQDVVYFGTFRVPAALLLERLVEPQSKPTALSIGDGTTVIGRAADADIVVNLPTISARHARLFRRGDDIVLEDLGSSNGTFVNHRRIHQPTILRPGDIVGLGTFSFTLNQEGRFDRNDDSRQVTVEAVGVGLTVPGKRLIEDCSLTIFPSEIVGLMGPSGAGKTTLMRALNGYTPPTKGHVYLNGQDLYAHYDQYRTDLGYVPQDDIIHGDLTVFQALYYSARLRLPSDFSNREITDRVKAVLKQLHLEGTENVLIGSPEKKGISGGQRKRVNLAMELLTDPLVLFLDEPTSGLSSEDARVVMKVLRELADHGKTILITIHQPGLDVYKMLDNLLIVGKDANSTEPGRILFYGPAYPDALGFFNPSTPNKDLSPDDLFQGLKRQPAEEWIDKFQRSSYCRRYVDDRAGQSRGGDRGKAEKATSNSRHFLQWKTLSERCFAIKLRDRMNTAILLAQAPVVAVLLVLVFGKQCRAETTTEGWPNVAGGVGTSLFLMGMAALWFGASNAVREIVGEWAIYRRERMVNLSIPSYVASKFTVLGTLSAIQCAILLAISYPGCALKSPWPILFLLLLLASFVGVAIGLVLSSVARTSEVAIGLLPIVLLAMVILGGAMLPMHDMNVFPRLIGLANPARWAFEGLVVAESHSQPEFTPPVPPVPKGATAPTTESIDMAEKFFPKEKHRFPRWAGFVVLGGLLISFVAGNLAILRWRDKS